MSGALLSASSPGGTELFPDAPYSATDFNISPTDSYAIIKFLANGQVWDQDGSLGELWINPASAADGNWYIRANSSSPDTPETGTMDSWLQLNSTRSWQVSELGIGTDSRSFTVDLKYGASGNVLATATCTITASVDV